MSGIEWCEITGDPSDEERAVVLAALEQYVRDSTLASGPSWGEIPVTRSNPEPAQSWSGSSSWTGPAPTP